MKTTASSGQEAADIVAAEHPDAVVEAFDGDLRSDGPFSWGVYFWKNEADRFDGNEANAIAIYRFDREFPE